MHMARAALFDAEPTSTTVTPIAVSYGFFELGRFAMNYRKMFGELPSTTLNRALIVVETNAMEFLFRVSAPLMPSPKVFLLTLSNHFQRTIGPRLVGRCEDHGSSALKLDDARDDACYPIHAAGIRQSNDLIHTAQYTFAQDFVQTCVTKPFDGPRLGYVRLVYCR